MKTKISLVLIAVLCLSARGFTQVKKEIQWIGGPTYILKLGSFKVLTDPMLGPKSKEAFRIKIHPTTGEPNAAIERFSDPAEFDRSNIDLLLISHMHPDHIDPAAVEILDKNLKTITTAQGVATMQRWGFTNVGALEWSDTLTLQKAGESLKITAVKSMHAQEPLNSELGKGNGYIIEYSSGKSFFRIYWTGDTVWFDEIASYTKYGKIDLLIPNMGAPGNGKRGLDALQALKIITALNPKKIIPVHHTTFSHYAEPISVLQSELSKTKYKKRLQLVPLGVPEKI
ncbi:MBL fold metallo-hydrolase [Flavobacterium psychroterrae]|uniref:MBL fold metallo-hydrolase n=1 Tax=Flavobacterium psychroterrae TaxID=2133767 RepID=A0ABS5PEA5_9FLAO|nr:MBL fold metallo-hydrolase [Flavobacterium psychroterrae]MBS7232620.1 MBL fold metallo-hydrolase [Flavobacterium psychroterrae]